MTMTVSLNAVLRAKFWKGRRQNRCFLLARCYPWFPLPGHMHQVRSWGRSFSSTMLWAPSEEVSFDDCKGVNLDEVTPLDKGPFLWTYTHGDRVNITWIIWICAAHRAIRQNVLEICGKVCNTLRLSHRRSTSVTPYRLLNTGPEI